ncbi:MAG: eukaryotic-like serine/threonine-protein kinase [Myxococcales bacterium]|jgi:serine/threonine-protein kinase|nr:eukaryotic-like serine/threonine-protein kinase [Myxococcales bacterium]
MLAEIDVGRVVAGKYELVRLIGKGAMGEVWLATHNSLGGEFAIKLVQPSDDEEDESAAGRFQLEAQVSAKLSRKTRHIVSVSDHGEEDGLAYLVMELLEGESLEARIKRVGELDLAQTTAIVTQVARALGQAHAEQIFHRDLKPANVFLTKDEDGRMLVKLLDFGIARTTKPFRTRSPFTTGKDMVLGTPSYMSPEQARGLDSLDHRCDLWALAVVAYEALTRQIPWEGETVEDIFLSICTHRMIPLLTRRSDLPPALEGVFARSFAPKLDERFRTATELSEAFEVLVDPLDVEAAMGPALGRGATSSRNLLAAPRARGYLHTPGEMAIYSGEPGSDPVGVAVAGPTLVTRKKRSSGWLIAVVAAVATIGIVALAITAFGSRDKSTSKNPPTDSTATPTSSDRASVPPPDPTPSSTTPVLTPPPTPTVKASPTRPPIAGHPPTPPKPPPTTPVVTPPVVTPPPPHPTPPPPSATTRKPPDKGEVF